MGWKSLLIPPRECILLFSPSSWVEHLAGVSIGSVLDSDDVGVRCTVSTVTSGTGLRGSDIMAMAV